ncbi:MAG: SDR family oxidoreductase [Thermodesulfobacteriota bacterium]
MKKVVIVSGGSRGIGQAIVEDLLASNCIVATFSRSESDEIKAMRAADPNEEKFYWQAIDIQESEAVKDFVFTVFKRYGRIDGLVNNTGVNLDSLISMTSDEEIDSVLSINLRSVFQLTRMVSRLMLTKNDGSIINISSIIGGARGFKGASVYGATKAALVGFSKSLARELGNKNIRANSILPGFIETKMTHGITGPRRDQIVRRTPLGRLGVVDDLTGVIRFLLSDESRFITGQSLAVDGGLTC